jgi:uncharacterized zinc-type alcohol dehydrogenase-like protein
MQAYMSLLAINGKLILVGASPAGFNVGAFDVLFRRKALVGSFIGGIKETQQMLDFCGKK